MITLEMVRKGLEEQAICLLPCPDDDYTTVCGIGENWFFFDKEANGMTPGNYCMLKKARGEDIAMAVFEALDEMRVSPDVYDAEYDYYEIILRKALQMPESRWIPVTERLPEKDEWVLLIVPDEFNPPLHIGRLHHTENKGSDSNVWGLDFGVESDWEVHGWCYYKTPYPTHWMPLEKLPEEDEIQAVLAKVKPEKGADLYSRAQERKEKKA